MIYLGDGSPTSGELAAERIATRIRTALAARKADLRLLGIGHSLVISHCAFGIAHWELGWAAASVWLGWRLDFAVEMDLPRNSSGVMPRNAK